MEKLEYKDLFKLSREDKQDFIEEYDFLKGQRTNYIRNIFSEINIFAYFLAFFILIIPLYQLAFGWDVLFVLLDSISFLIKIYIFVLIIIIGVYFGLAIFDTNIFLKKRKELINRYFNFKKEVEIKRIQIIKPYSKRGKK